jgi:acetyl esterase/lipase
MTGRRRAALEHGPLRHAEPDGCPLRLDLHLPAGGGPWPVALWLHGGGWAVGARTCALTSVRCRWRTGVAVAAVQYRLTDRATFPAQLDDARAAVRWQRAHGAGHGLSTDRDGELGDSSVQAVVSWFPPTDLLSRAGDVPDGPRRRS